MPDRPDVFAFVERHNGYDRVLNLLTRSRTALVSQQISLKTNMGESAERFNRCMQAYNDHLVPVLESTEAHSRVIVLFSTFRGCAVLLSDIEETRVVGDAPRHLGPMPTGFGVVYPSLHLMGVRPDRTAREAELLEIAQCHFSPEIFGAATYLATCLSTQRS